MPGCCEECGEEDRPVFPWVRLDPWGRPAHQTLHLCQPCIDNAENEEPREPDGEAFRGGEAATFTRERQAEALRVK